ncbi:MAG: Rieske (2Fe-2S) protein [Cellvibrionaceae bacterium]|nr:Rieske (2Fe-2S) protein [Cellvibrionaceae bacterium]
MAWQSLEFDPNGLAETQCRGFELAGVALFVVKKYGELFFYHNRCPHRGINLEWQADVFLDYEKSLIHCASHGAMFTIREGRCVAGPCVGQQLQAVEARRHEGRWQLNLPAAAAAAGESARG